MHHPHQIVGTAGHIDHGKSALVRALTGTDPDRLQEERERGITIDLGFADTELADGTRVGFVDVPGHERFVKNMLAGIGGIDAVLLVVAADESIKPQTREHLAICELLGVSRGVVAISKCDLVDDEIAELVALEVRELLEGTGLAEAPIVHTSIHDGAGMETLRAALAEVLAATDARPHTPLVRLPVDRVFTLRGFGTVITGTLLSGRIAAGDRLELLPRTTAVNVRGVQVYGEPVDAARAGQRTAVNLQGIDVDAVARGDLLVTPGCLQPGSMLDVRVNMLTGHQLEHQQRVRFHHGAVELLCRVALLQEDDVAAGGTALAQLRLESPYACVPGDRFVLRRYSPMLTIGGGTVIDTDPRKHRRSEAAARTFVKALENASPVERLALFVAEAGESGGAEAGLRRRLFVTRERLAVLADELAAADRVLVAQRDPLLLLDADRADELTATLRAVVDRYHREQPLTPAVPKSALAAALPPTLPEAGLDALIRLLVARGELRAGEAGVAAADHAVELSREQKHLRDELLRLFDEAGLAPPSTADAVAQLQVPSAAAEEILRLLLRRGELVRLRNDLVYHAGRLEELVAGLRQRHDAGASFDVADFKEWTGLSRKHAIPLLEYLDEHRVTRRVGDRRIRV